MLGDDRLQNNCKAMLGTFVPQAHSLEDGLGVLDISCGGRAGPGQGSQGCVFFPAKASDTGVIRTGGCEFAKSELLHTCTANLSEIFIFSILYC